MDSVNAAVPISLGYDPSLKIPLCGQEGWKPDADDKLPWIVDDRGSGAGSQGLKNFLQAEADRIEGRGPGRVHLPGDVVGEVAHSGSEWICRYVFNGQQCQSAATTRDGAIMAATKYIHVKTKAEVVRPLTEKQLNLIGSLAASGKISEAIDKFVVLSLTKQVAESTLMSDPRYAEMLDRAVFFVWSQANNQYSLENDSNFLFYLEKYARGKAHLTIALLNECWQSFQTQRTQRQREAVVAAKFAEPTDAKSITAEIEEGSDEEIRDLYTRTMNHIAHTAR